MIQAHPYMTFDSFDCGPLPAAVSVSRFQGATAHRRGGVEEFHLMVRPTQYASIEAQLESISEAYRSALSSIGLGPGTCVLRRFFCSDLPNQAAALESHPFANPHDQDEPCAVSWAGQAPPPPAKVALWAYHVDEPGVELTKIRQGASLSLKRGELTHIWTTGVTCPDRETSYGQTEGIFEKYEGCLQVRGLRLDQHVIRTWFFVRDVDANYQGLAAARRDVFATRGLTPDTHFIASTGIEGRSADFAATVTMDAYAISGVRPEQIRFLSAPEHLSPTHIYGVTFERGVSVAYRDRKHVIISGTASIDSAGSIVHPGDVLGQLDRTMENVEALLRQADATFEDVCVLIAYVRDPSDLGVAQQAMSERFGEAPIQVVVAPVCRPGWLIEVECQAIIPISNPALPAF